MTRPSIAVLAAALASLTVPGAAAATDGNLYAQGASVWAASPQSTAAILAGPVWQIQTTALSPATIGNIWEMNWGCPVGGSEVAAVLWGGLRTKAPSSLEVRVLGNGNVLWAEPDSAMPVSPAAGRGYDLRLPSGYCNVHLVLTQVETRNQHARGYFVDSPRVLIRDVAPPSVGIRSLSPGWLRPTGTVRVAWVTDDNFGNDGIGAQRIVIAGQEHWSGAPGAGEHALDLGLAGVPDGVHAVEVRAEGDGTAGGAASGTISVDGTPPTATGLAESVSGTPGAATLSWVAADNLSGVAASRVEINEATDGSTGGSWESAGSVGGGGPKSLMLDHPSLADGPHAWRVVVADAAGNERVVAAGGRVVIDTTPPRIDVHAVPAGWVNRADLDLTVSDNLQATLGIGATEIDVNAAADGGDGGEWLRRSSASAPAGRRVVPLDLKGLEDGRHAIRIVARNGGPFGSSLVAEKRATIRVDLTDPSISRTAFSAGGARPMTVSWVAEDASAGVASATVQWRDGSAWRTLASEKATNGSGSVVVDASALPDGDRAVRLVIADAAGNATVTTDTVAISGGGAGSTAADPQGRLRDARLAITVWRARPERRGPRVVLVRRLVAGTTVRISGRLRDRAGRAIVGSEVQVRDPRGRVIGRGLTRRGGRFAIEARPIGGGVVRVGVAVGRELLPRRVAVDLRLDVRPVVALGVSRTSVGVGEQVLFSGRLRPAPADLGLGSRKGIVLEWLDPVRHTWRPVVNARIRTDGTFAIPWTFGLGGLTIPMRVVVPAEVGWPLLPATSGVIRVRVR